MGLAFLFLWFINHNCTNVTASSSVERSHCKCQMCFRGGVKAQPCFYSVSEIVPMHLLPSAYPNNEALPLGVLVTKFKQIPGQIMKITMWTCWHLGIALEETGKRRIIDKLPFRIFSSWLQWRASVGPATLEDCLSLGVQDQTGNIPRPCIFFLSKKQSKAKKQSHRQERNYWSKLTNENQGKWLWQRVWRVSEEVMALK